MTKLLPALFIALISGVSAFAQTTTPTPPNDDVVRISTSLIQLDVTVTDSKGNPVKDLRRDEIEIYENGKKQDISNFSFVNGHREIPKQVEKVKTTTTAIPIPPTSSNMRPESVRRAIALVVDDLTLSFGSIANVRQALKKFINEQMQDGDLVAIVRTGGGVGMLQQFTTDKQQLLAAAANIKFNLAVRPGIFEPLTLSLKEELNGVKGTDGSTSDYGADIAREQQQDRAISNQRDSALQTGTLGALNFIVRGMAGLPGRKSIMLLSDGLSLVERNAEGRQTESLVGDGIRRLIDFANRSSVVFYTLDARGLAVVMPEAADRITDIFSSTTINKLQNRENDFRDKQDGLIYLAKETGGLAFINQNSLSRGIANVLNDQSYYLVAYEPGGDSFDAKTRRYNKMSVKVSRPGVSVRYRSGFFGVPDREVNPNEVATGQSLIGALNSPFAAQDITLRFNPIFVAGPNNSLYVKSYLHLKAGDLTFNKQADGSYKTVFEIAGVTVGENGVPLDSSAKQFTLSLKGDIYERMMQKGIVYEFVYSLKKAGAFQYRVAVRDVGSNRVGSANQFLNVPNLKKDKLSLSGVLFENLTRPKSENSDPIGDTALRQFKQGSVVRYGYSVYDPKVEGAAKPDLESFVRIYREGNLIYESPVLPINAADFDPASGLTSTGLVKIGTAMEAGEYFLLIIVRDKNAKGSSSVATQFISFEVVD